MELKIPTHQTAQATGNCETLGKSLQAKLNCLPWWIRYFVQMHGISNHENLSGSRMNGLDICDWNLYNRKE